MNAAEAAHPRRPLRQAILRGLVRAARNDDDPERQHAMRVPARFRPPISPRELVTRTIGGIADDDCMGLAAQLAFYSFLALFPAPLFLVALLSYLPIDRAVNAGAV